MRAGHAVGNEPRQKIGREPKEIHAEAGVAPERSVVHPERINALIRMPVARRIDPSLAEKPLKRGPSLGLHHGVFAP